MKVKEVFLVSSINEDAMLGMPFLVAHNCAMEFTHSTNRWQEAEVH